MNKELTGNIEAFEMQCYRKVLQIPYTDHVTNEDVLTRMEQKRALLGRVRLQKLRYFGHIARHDSLEKDIMLGPMPGLRRQGGQRRQGLDDISDWCGKKLPELVRETDNRLTYRLLIHSVAYARPPGTVH